MLNNLWLEFIKRVVAGWREARKVFEKLWAGRKVHFYSKLKVSNFFFPTPPQLNDEARNFFFFSHRKSALMALNKKGEKK